jgi:hypothetical protein
VYCEIIINRGVLFFFIDFVIHLNHKNQNPTKYNFPFNFVVCSVWNQKFKNPGRNAFCRNHKYWCQLIKVLSQYTKKGNNEILPNSLQSLVYLTTNVGQKYLKLHTYTIIFQERTFPYLHWKIYVFKFETQNTTICRNFF